MTSEPTSRPTKAPSIFNLGMVKGAIIGLVIWLLISLPTAHFLSLVSGEPDLILVERLLTWEPIPMKPIEPTHIEDNSDVPAAYLENDSKVTAGKGFTLQGGMEPVLPLIFTLKNFVIVSMPWLILGGLIGGIKRRNRLLDMVRP